MKRLIRVTVLVCVLATSAFADGEMGNGNKCTRPNQPPQQGCLLTHGDEGPTDNKSKQNEAFTYFDLIGVYLLSFFK